MVTVYDIARQAGVSTATVSRVLHGPRPGPPRNPAARRRRDRAARLRSERVGAGPNRCGARTSSAWWRSNGAPTRSTSSAAASCMDEIVHAVEGVLRRGTEISLLFSFGPRGESFQRRIQTLSGKVDGLLMAEDVLPASQLVALAKRVPLVLIAWSADSTGLDALTVDNAGGVRAAVTHLTGVHGYRRLCTLGGCPSDSPDAKQRLAAFGEAVRAAEGRRVPASLLFMVTSFEASGFGRGPGQAGTRHRAGGGGVRQRDQMAIGLDAGVPMVRGRCVPGRVAVTGFDDIYPARLTDPLLTTVEEKALRELGSGRRAGLLDRIGSATFPPAAEVLLHPLARGRSAAPPIWSSAAAAAAGRRGKAEADRAANDRQARQAERPGQRQADSPGRACGQRQTARQGERDSGRRTSARASTGPRSARYGGSGRDRTDSGWKSEGDLIMLTRVRLLVELATSASAPDRCLSGAGAGIARRHGRDRRPRRATASATTVPPPPSGWTTTYSDSFGGVEAARAWTRAGLYDTGTQAYNGTGCTANWGTGEVETNTSSTAANVAGGRQRPPQPHRRSGTPTAAPGHRAASRPSRPTSRLRLAARSKSAPRSSSPTPVQRARLLARVLDAGRRFRSSGAGIPRARWTARTGRLPVRSTSWRTSTRCPSTPGRCTAGTDPGGPCDETTGLSSGLQACSRLPDGLQHVLGDRQPDQHRRRVDHLRYYLNGTA